MAVDRVRRIARRLFTYRLQLKVGFLSAGDENTASSRMRVHTIRRALADQNIPTFLSYAPGLDVLIIQKKVTEWHIEIAKKARAEGCLLVYDVDDLDDALWYWTTPSLLERLVDMADLLITATADYRDALRRQFGARRISVIPCPIDYFPNSLPSADIRSEGPLRVLWFGNASNLGLLEPYLEPLVGMANVKPIVATNAECIDAMAHRHPSIECVTWSLETFPATLRAADISLLMHDGSPADRSKSNNKMVTSIAWGVPAVVSRTPEYERTARELGVGEAVFDGPSSVAATIERLRDARVRAAYIGRAQPLVWHRYAASVVARELMDVLKSACWKW